MNRLPNTFAKCINLNQIQIGLKREFHVTGVNCDITWRRDRRLPKNPTSSGPLTDLPDYSYMDGRPTPLGVHQRRRLEHQREIAQKIVQGIKEVNSAKENYQRKLIATEEERQSILNAKLEPKGRFLNKK